MVKVHPDTIARIFISEKPQLGKEAAVGIAEALFHVGEAKQPFTFLGEEKVAGVADNVNHRCQLSIDLAALKGGKTIESRYGEAGKPFESGTDSEGNFYRFSVTFDSRNEPQVSGQYRRASFLYKLECFERGAFKNKLKWTRQVIFDFYTNIELNELAKYEPAVRLYTAKDIFSRVESNE